MLKQKNIKAIIKRVFNLTKKDYDQAEVILGTTQSTTIRYANNIIYQPMANTSYWLKIRLIKNKKIAVVNTNSLSDSAIEKVLKTGKQFIKLQKPDRSFVSLPKEKKPIKKKYSSFNQQTHKLKEEKLAQLIYPLIKKAKNENFISSGKIEKTTEQLAVANNLGVFRYQPSTSVFFSLTLRNEGQKASSYQEAMGKNINDLKLNSKLNQALKTARQSKNPKKVAPGNYEAIFMPTAFQEILPYFSWLGPNARVYHEEVSFLKEKLNKKIFSPKLTISDQPINPISPAYFDFEGYPKKNMALVEKGIPKNICYDSYYSHKYNFKNTGHGLPAPNTEGPIPIHLNIKTGKNNLQQMIKNTKKGLLINRLWYIRVIHYKTMMLTGMTRDGTFYIENGKIKHPVQNLRFTDSIPNLFKNIEKISKTSTWQSLMWGIAKIPIIKVSKFRFTS
jgi:PmbA protein